MNLKQWMAPGFVLIVLFLAGCDISSRQESQENDPNFEFRYQLFAQIDQIRHQGTNCGGTIMPPVGNLLENQKIDDAAQMHSDDMKDHRFYSHRGSDGSFVGNRLAKQGVQYCNSEELLAKFDGARPQDILSLWRANRDTCMVLMNASFNEVGFGRTEGLHTLNLAKTDCVF